MYQYLMLDQLSNFDKKYNVTHVEYTIYFLKSYFRTRKADLKYLTGFITFLFNHETEIYKCEIQSKI